MAIIPPPGERPTEPGAFADAFLHALLRDSPDLAANLGIDAVAGHELPRDRLPDFSPSGLERRRALMADWERAYRHVVARPAEDDLQITRAVLDYAFEEGLFSVFPGRLGRDFVDPPYPVTHLSGFHAVVTMMLVRDHDFGAPDAAERYVELLSRVPLAARETIETLRCRRAAGLVAPASVLRQAEADLRAFQVPADDNLLLRALAEGLQGQDDAAGWLDRARRVVADGIYPAYREVLDELALHVAAGEDRAGAWRLPDGDAYYAWCLRRYTTTDLTPDAVHELGLQETARVQDRVREQARALKLEGSTMAELFAAAGARAAPPPYADDAAGLAGYVQEWIARSADALRPAFGLWPRGSIEVQTVPPAFESSLHSHYAPPGHDRPGRFLLNVRHARAAWPGDLDVLCYHEAFPGHHVQLAVAQERDELPLFRRVLTFAGYLEGWAKYAETLPESLGIDSDPLYAFSRLRSELYSTVNLVLDTGIHAKRWSQDQAQAFFEREAGASKELARMIAARSVVVPGQLASYKIGMLRMFELLDRFGRRKGSSERLADFHDAVLGGGALPLTVLERTFDQAVAASPSTALR